MTTWFRMEADDALLTLETNPDQGLTQAEAERRITAHGPNELIERGLKSPWLIFWEQLTAIMVVILIIAEDKQNTNVFYVSYGTSTNPPVVHGDSDEVQEYPAPLDLYYSFSQDRGESFAEVA